MANVLDSEQLLSLLKLKEDILQGRTQWTLGERESFRKALRYALDTIWDPPKPGCVAESALERLVIHDEAADMREGLPNCIELQEARAALKIVWVKDSGQ